MRTDSSEYLIGIPIYHGVDLMDVAAPREIFSWMGENWKAEGTVRILLVGDRKDLVVKTRDGTRIMADAGWKDVLRVDLMWVPGANVPDLKERMKDRKFLEHLRHWAEHARWVTSVCEGALLLAAAGLLDGYRATTHWAFIECLCAYREIDVVGGGPNPPRFVFAEGRDGAAPRMTGAGISAGMDEALELVRRIAGPKVAAEVQRVTQYYPKPPIRARLPDAGDCPLAA